jgi:hypothetical protein
MQLRIWANGKLCSLGKHCWHCVGDDKLADYLTRYHWPSRKDRKREFEVLVATVEALAADRHLKHFAIREMHPVLAFVTRQCCGSCIGSIATAAATCGRVIHGSSTIQNTMQKTSAG